MCTLLFTVKLANGLEESYGVIELCSNTNRNGFKISGVFRNHLKNVTYSFVNYHVSFNYFEKHYFFHNCHSIDVTINGIDKKLNGSLEENEKELLSCIRFMDCIEKLTLVYCMLKRDQHLIF